MIVDDEQDLISIISIHFEAAGWEVHTSQNGKEALAKMGVDTPLIFITGFRDVDKMKRAWSLCVFDFLDKPFSEKNMMQIAENAYHYGKDYVQAARKRFSKLKKVS